MRPCLVASFRPPPLPSLPHSQRRLHKCVVVAVVSIMAKNKTTSSSFVSVSVCGCDSYKETRRNNIRRRVHSGLTWLLWFGWLSSVRSIEWTSKSRASRNRKKHMGRSTSYTIYVHVGRLKIVVSTWGTGKVAADCPAGESTHRIIWFWFYLDTFSSLRPVPCTRSHLAPTHTHNRTIWTMISFLFGPFPLCIYAQRTRQSAHSKMNE